MFWIKRLTAWLVPFVLGVVVGPLMLWRDSKKKAAVASAPAVPTA